MRMQNRIININEINKDYIFYEYYLNSDVATHNPKDSMIKFIKNAIAIALTDKQKMYFTEHFVNGKTVSEIAVETGRAKSTVSREITRAKNRIKSFAPLYFNK